MARGKFWLAHSTRSRPQTSILQNQHSTKTVHIVLLISFLKYTNGIIIKTNWTKATCKQWVKYHSYLQHWIVWNLPILTDFTVLTDDVWLCKTHWVHNQQAGNSWGCHSQHEQLDLEDTGDPWPLAPRSQPADKGVKDWDKDCNESPFQNSRRTNHKIMWWLFQYLYFPQFKYSLTYSYTEALWYRDILPKYL